MYDFKGSLLISINKWIKVVYKISHWSDPPTKKKSPRYATGVEAFLFAILTVSMYPRISKVY